MNMNRAVTAGASTPEHLDVLIIGAGISGIDAAYNLNTQRAGTTYRIVESKGAIGGTWHTHRFPGIRSDSDLFTFGFKWKPWTGIPIATADEILKYLNEAVDEQGIREKIDFNQKVLSAEWSSAAQCWSVTLENGDGEVSQLNCGFLWTCAGYFDHENGYTPKWSGMETFAGQIVHPQSWPDDLEVAGKKVVVVGSGATAATIVPALAGKVGSLKVLQRSPTYYIARPQMDDFSTTLAALDLPQEWHHEIMRRKFLYESKMFVERAKSEPEAVAEELIGSARSYLGEDYDVGTHFTPRYRPWRQRVAMIPEGDFFVAIREGLVEMVTDEIETFTADGLALKSGDALEADIIVTATGLNLTMFGEIDLVVDGALVDPAKCYTHRGMMFSGVPNLVNVFGYLRSSWTMRAGLVSDYVVRLLGHMDASGARVVTPRLRAEDTDMVERPWIDPENFDAGYIMRSLDKLPRQGDKQPWVMTQNYHVDRFDVPAADLDDGTLIYEAAKVAAE